MNDDLVKRLRDWEHVYPDDYNKDDGHLYNEAADRIEELESNIKELFVLLERTEQTDEGRLFHPVRIYCNREMDRVKLEQVLRKLKGEK